MENYWSTRRWREATAQHEIIEHMRLLLTLHGGVDNGFML